MIDSSIKLGVKITEDVRILEIDLSVSDGVGGIKQNFTFSVELDRVSGFVHSVGWLYQWKVGDPSGFNSDVLLVHVLNVVDSVGWFEVFGLQAHW